MAMDLAEIGLKADASYLKQARDELQGFRGDAKSAEQAAKGFENSEKDVERASSSLGSALDKVGLGFSAVGGFIVGAAAALGTFLAANAGFQSFIDNTVEMEDMQAQLAAAIKSTGSAAGQTIDSLNEHAAALQRVTTYGDDAISGAQKILLTFTRIGGDVFPKATEAVTNLATRMGGDLQGAAIQVGKALNDPIQGVTALGRAGIQFTEEQKAMIASMVESNNIIGAQAIVLKELEVQFGGSAVAARDTLGGAITSLSNAFGDLFEMGPESSGPLRTAIEELITAISSEAFGNFVETIGVGMFNAATLATEAITVFVGVLPQLYDLAMVIAPALALIFGPTLLASMATLATTLTSMVIPAFVTLGTVIAANPIGAVATAIVLVISYLYQMREELGLTEGNWARLGQVILKAIEIAVEALSSFYDLVEPYLTAVWELVTDIATGIRDAWVGAFEFMKENVGPVLEWLLGWLEEITGASNKTASAVGGIKASPQSAGAATGNAVAEGGKKAAEAIGQGMEKSGKTAAKDIGTATEGTGEAMASGGKQAAASLDKTFDKAAEKQTNINDVFVSKFEGTGRNIYDLWNNWGDLFLDSFGTSIGKLLIEFQQAQTRLLNAQAAQAASQAALNVEQAKLLEAQRRSGDYRGGGSTGSSSASSSGGGGGGGGGKGNVIDLGGYVDGQGQWHPEYKRKELSSETLSTTTTDTSSANSSVGNMIPQKPNLNLKIINQTDPLDTLNALATAEGEDTIINILANNRELLSRLLGVA